MAGLAASVIEIILALPLIISRHAAHAGHYV